MLTTVIILIIGAVIDIIRQQLLERPFIALLKGNRQISKLTDSVNGYLNEEMCQETTKRNT